MTDGTAPWENAWAAVRSNRYTEAERLCRQGLELLPQDADGWFLLGVVCHLDGHRQDAVENYKHALKLRPDWFEAHGNLGNALLDLNRPAEAAEAFRGALVFNPDHAESHENLGIALLEQSFSAEAAQSFAEALRLRPDYAEAHNNLGNALRNLGRLSEASRSYRLALQLDSSLAETHLNLGNVLREIGEAEEASKCFRNALLLRPNWPEANNNLGNTLWDQGRLLDAAECFRRALTLRPEFVEAWINLGGVMRNVGRFEEAVRCLQQALQLRPDMPEIYKNLGIARRHQGQLQEAEKCLRRALQLRSEFPEAYHDLANVLREECRLTEAEASYRRSVEQRSDYTLAFDGLLQSLHYREDSTLETIAAEHAEYEKRFAEPLRRTWRPHTNQRDAERPLRIGFVSPDFGLHPVGFLLVRAFEALARRECILVAYSTRYMPADVVTTRFQRVAAAWREVAGVSDERMAETIRGDQIDILIDLAGHTAGNCLLVFARRPAPVQVSWLGYEGTTGLKSIDYIVADPYLIPSWAEQFFVERVLRLPGGYVCYDPPTHAPEPGPLPALRDGRVTFGCFNNPAKLTTSALTAFARILFNCPGSRLILQYRGLNDPASAGRLQSIMTEAGVEKDRLVLRGQAEHFDYFAAHREIDIALDPFPFGGGVTTCDALWMGVPVVSLAGQTFASRHGLSHLSGIGLAELAAKDVNQYVELTVTLAGDLDRLAKLRTGLRNQMASSPLCDGDRVADELLTVLRYAWRRWISSGIDPKTNA